MCAETNLTILSHPPGKTKQTISSQGAKTQSKNISSFEPCFAGLCAAAPLREYIFPPNLQRLFADSLLDLCRHGHSLVWSFNPNRVVDLVVRPSLNRLIQIGYGAQSIDPLAANFHVMGRVALGMDLEHQRAGRGLVCPGG